MENQRTFLDSVGKEIGVADGDLSSWYNISRLEISSESEGRIHLRNFQGSRHKLFSAAFPEHIWHERMFLGSTLSNSSNENKIFDEKLKLLKHLEEELRISKPEDWCDVSRLDFASVGLVRLFRSQTQFLEFLRSVYPNFNWIPTKMRWSTLGFSHLSATLSELFPGIEGKGVIPSKTFFSSEEFLSPELKDSILVVPEFKLMFYYQGPIAYARNIIKGSENLTKSDDSSLLDRALSSSLTLLSIPFWWDRSRSSILAELFAIRPDLFEHIGPLSAFRDSAMSSKGIPTSVSLTDLKLNYGSYLRVWSKDPRFSHLMVSSGSPHSRKLKRKGLSDEHDSLLREKFDLEPKPGRAHMVEIGRELGLSEEIVQKWFKRRRELMSKRRLKDSREDDS